MSKQDISPISINQVQSVLRDNPAIPLQFYFDSSFINPGYQITEVRQAIVNTVDHINGGIKDTWHEITIQLLEGLAESSESNMLASKFQGFLNHAISEQGNVTDARLFFEYAPGNSPLRKLAISSIDKNDNELSFFLAKVHP